MAIIAKYKFNSTLYADLIPEFNAEFTNYTVTDETTETDGEGNVIKTRVIEHDTLLPTQMRFGIIFLDGENATDREKSLLEVLDMNTNELTTGYCMFYRNINLININCNWNLSKLTNTQSMFRETNLTSLDVSNWNTSNVTNMGYTFQNCKNLTTLDVSNWDTSNVIDMRSMFQNCQSLTSLDVSNWDTKNVTNMQHMFNGCANLTSLDVSNFDTSNVTNMGSIFATCTNLTSLDLSNFNTSKVINMANMFYGCNKLTLLDVSGFNTSKVTNMGSMFHSCNNLTLLDVSNWDTGKVTNMSGMFYQCKLLTSLDVSNFDTSEVTDFTNIFFNTPLLTDIGMLYCSQSTINALSSNITTPSTNVWVEGGMIDDLTSYDNVTYKAYYWEKEVLLNSPLLEGDKIVKKDGKLYHYHKMGMVVLDGSDDEGWINSADGTFVYKTLSIPAKKRLTDSNNHIESYCDKLPCTITEEGGLDYGKGYVIHRYGELIWMRCHSDITTSSSASQWLQQNPTTIVYELANPYYELISDTSEDLSLSLLSEDNIISNNSLIPTNMNVENNGMTTVAMQSSTKYTVAFDKDTDSSVTIDLCGSTIDTTDNVVEITTPSELANDEITFIGDCEVSNVRILEGSVSGDAIPKESFEGLKNSFEEGKSRGIFDFNGVLVQGKILKRETGEIVDSATGVCCEEYIQVKPNTTYKVHDWVNFGGGVENTRYCFYDKNKIYLGAGDTSSSTTPENCTYIRLSFTINDNYDIEKAQIQLEEGAIATEYIPYGKYKVEYKVTGKNKFDNSVELYNIAPNYTTWEFISGGYKLTTAISFAPRVCNHSRFSVEIGKSYTVSANVNVCSGNLGTAGLRVAKINADGTIGSTIMYLHSGNPKWSFTSDGTYNEAVIQLYGCSHEGTTETAIIEYTNIQLEEGTTATSYEPYKEYTKTFYLNSPLLEGDTIEDINGVATHVHRRGSKLLDGSEEGWYLWDVSSSLINTIAFAMPTNGKNGFNEANNSSTVFGNTICDKFIESTEIIDSEWHMTHSNIASNNRWWSICINKSKLSTQDVNGFKQWLSENPTTVVYELASPQYEPISTESILCDSYVNGHLDVDSNIPVKKVKFNGTSYIMKYLQPSTNYIVQFESDSVGKLNKDYLSNTQYPSMNVVKGLNRFNVITPNEITHTYLGLQGIGFNASNIQVVATDRDNIRYFKGIQSSFEDKLVEDETNENYGKYEVKVTLEDENGVISNEFIYLNSPLLKGDKIEMYNGKLCHYHKMGKVVLDGSEKWVSWGDSTNPSGYSSYYAYYGTTGLGIPKGAETEVICNTFKYNKASGYMSSSEGVNSHHNYLTFTSRHEKLGISDSTSFADRLVAWKSWLSKNPTTVIYELKEPYYEDITPIQNEFIITSIGESSFTIDSGAIPTDGEITYSVNVKLLNDLEESINNNTSSTDTDLSTILDDIINE